ncbi:MAG: peptidase M1 [Saprospiraceae bacterium]|nr:peptidase M1 [Saprospiraceae bacterium]
MTNCESPPPRDTNLEAGVSLALAQARAQEIQDVRYNLFFNIPAELDASIPASMEVKFSLETVVNDLILDFRADSSQVIGVQQGGETIDFRFEQEHLILPKRYLSAGENSFQIKFIAGDQSLNRSEEYLYTLFVPERAATAFPCFDQPDIKAKYTLSLELPADWVAVANGSLLEKKDRTDRVVYRFRESAPISTYLFAFGAGKLRQETRTRDGREMTLFFRETDDQKVAANVEVVFDLHATALKWLEDYTGIPYPFEKFDFALFPTFQYGGMEHVGSIFYRESSLFLDETATETQKLSRASLIAHETAHMWFGDLVTMEWFNDVWLKEVFANFMAAKIVNPSFPEINHDLRFLLAHQPAAYGEDRSEGTHPIQQKLENLKDAGTLYGRIIYQKAPVVMRQLETLLGEEQLREGLREYLKVFSFGNATWDDLIGILDKRTEIDLANWSQVWVKEAGMPQFTSRLEGQNLVIDQKPQAESGRFWTEQTDLILFEKTGPNKIPIQIEGQAQTSITLAEEIPEGTPYILNGSPMSYGYFPLESGIQSYLLENSKDLADPLLRGATRMALYESCLRGELSPNALFSSLLEAVPLESEPLNRRNLLGNLRTLYWRFLDAAERSEVNPKLEGLLWQQLQENQDISAKSAYFQAFVNIAQTNTATDQLYAVWSGEQPVEGLPLSESQLTNLACELALRLPAQADQILDQQYAAIKNPDRQKRLAFIRPALSAEVGVRDQFFESLKEAENRHYEPWVGSALNYLHHPLRAKEAEKYILPSLALMEEIQVTGDIFFPRRWVTATLSGHQSTSSARIVRDFLAERPDYPYRLKNKILMGADLLFRAEKGLD